MADPHAEGRKRIEDAVLRGAGETDPEIRRAAAARAQALPPELRALVEKIHQHAYRVTDEDIVALRTGRSEDALFEIIVAAAVGAAGERLDKALAALEEATR